MSDTYLKIRNSDGTEFTETALLSFSFRKDAYTPYTSLNARAVTNETLYSSAAEILLYVEGILVHHGLIDSIGAETSGGITVTSFASRGFSSLLCQNQIEPGLKLSISFNALMDSYYVLPYVTHEDNSDASNYIYVKNHSTMWDGVVNLSYKLNGTYPYIRGTNCVRITPVSQPSAFVYTGADLLSTGSRISGKRLVSNFHMSDINGDFGTFELTDSDVTAQKIVRHQFFELDRQFLYSPQDALVFRDKYCTRGWKQRFCTYSGYNGEDISDTVTFSGVNAERIASVTITGSSSGIITEVGIYSDKFPREIANA
ncbi:MAG: hypothetical protein IKO47_04015 [Ruminococcus sp.]|nr:hypothetical protein [Ruminococcus sp.]